MNEVLLSWNSHSGKYSLTGASGFLIDRYVYVVSVGLWADPKTLDPLDLSRCTKPTRMALEQLSKVIEMYYD